MSLNNITLEVNEDRVANEIMQVLDEYEISYAPNVIRHISVPAWLKAKRPLLELFSRHPQWNNDTLSVLFKTRYERTIDADRAEDLTYRLVQHYRNSLPMDNVNAIEYMTRQGELQALSDALCYRSMFYTSKITKENQSLWLDACPVGKTDKDPKRFFPIGLRVSRALDRLFKAYGIDKWENYDKNFAQLADCVNPLNIDRTTALSLHPCDYLLMSHGTGWDSCHRINMKYDHRGEWVGGVWSYMFDDLSTILYTTEQPNGPIWNREKVNRMVCCFSGDEILFSRLYPQVNEFNSDLRGTFRKVVQEIYSECMDMPNLWQPPIHAAKSGWCCNGEGHMNYEDYTVHDWLTELSVAKGHEPHYMYIGTYGICPVSGNEYDEHESITSENAHCSHCGRRIREGHTYYWEGDEYCESCYNELFATCVRCGTVHRVEDMFDTEDGWVCRECLNDEGYVECNWCMTLVRPERAIETGDGDTYCRHCARRHVRSCEKCGRYYNINDLIETSEVDPDGWHITHTYCSDCAEAVAEEVRSNA